MWKEVIVSTRILALSSALIVGGLLVTGCSERLPGVPSSFATSAGSTEASRGPEYADVSNQGGPAAGVYAPGGGSLLRQPDGLQVKVTMPVPAPGSYAYPMGYTPGHPEVFTLWVFIFNYPELCSAPCDMNDLGVDKPAKGTVYNAAGHPVSGNSLTLAGRVRVGETPFDHPVLTFGPLENPAGAEVHLAVAPHGEVDPSRFPDEFRLPTGTPAFWWVAIFD